MKTYMKPAIELIDVKIDHLMGNDASGFEDNLGLEKNADNLNQKLGTTGSTISTSGNLSREDQDIWDD